MTFLRAEISAKILEILHEMIKPGIYTIDGKKFYLTNEVFNPKYSFTSKFIVENLFLKPDWTVLDMGTGSGYVAIQIADRVKSVTAVDINDIAVRCCKINIKLNNVNDKVKALRSNLFSSLKSEKFNTIIFNPPYLKGDPENVVQQAWLHNSPENLIKKFAAESRDYLVKRGLIQIVYSSISGLNFIIKKVFEDEGFKFILDRKTRFLWEIVNFLVFQLNR
ncbi:MAG: methyltransferase [Candidatus Odinarchaeum yellowstonii]|uniref:Methyltransferase n=1 Tax=Odinarchaeota yellowstonii (strain LCB_4) TaxID=1841599 RepID=A0AAF0IC66_ODILC|nr:MAG: methyltransferase [Candidatus Odinarchaeum yellowstonii]